LAVHQSAGPTETPVKPPVKRGARVRLVFGLALAVLLSAVALVSRTGPAADLAGALRRDATFVALFSGPVPAAPIMTATALDDQFTEQGYTLEALRSESVAVPRLFLAKLPADLPTLDSISLRKEVFVKMLLPLILVENERILAEREQLLKVRDRLKAGGTLSGHDEDWLEALAEQYGVDDDAPDSIPELIRRVDAVPPSLAIGQAALETGWGTSDVAHRGQAMFGQMVATGSSVRRFEHLAHAVEAYALNLNTHKAYHRFRTKRADMRGRGLAPDGYDLALTLGSYSERKMDYVRDVRGIIKANKFRPLDQARLD
jgi:Bax protein